MYVRSTFTEMPRTVIELALISFILTYFAISLTRGADVEGALSTLGLFAYAGLRLQPSVQRILSGLNEIKFSAAPVQEIISDLAIRPFATDERLGPLPFEKAVRLEGVSFRYSGASSDALQEVNLEILAGEVVGICGPTGGGKTTLVDLLTGLLHPTRGQITVDGVDLSGAAGRWFLNLGVVPQMVFLVDDTLRRNIALGVDDADIDETAVRDAVELAQLNEFVASLPSGLDAQVGELGVRISGGERQRLAIARALYRRPRVLVFDEGTSALDNATESRLIEAIDRLRGDRTIILVAHRLSTVGRSDRVLFVEGGRVTGDASYAELLQTHKGFQVLADKP